MINLGQLLDTLQDVQHELGEPEIAELISLALDRKVERAIKELKKELDIDQEN